MSGGRAFRAHDLNSERPISVTGGRAKWKEAEAAPWLSHPGATACPVGDLHHHRVPARQRLREGDVQRGAVASEGAVLEGERAQCFGLWGVSSTPAPGWRQPGAFHFHAGVRVQDEVDRPIAQAGQLQADRALQAAGARRLKGHAQRQVEVPELEGVGAASGSGVLSRHGERSRRAGRSRRRTPLGAGKGRPGPALGEEPITAVTPPPDRQPGVSGAAALEDSRDFGIVSLPEVCSMEETALDHIAGLL